MEGDDWRVRLPEGLIAQSHTAWGYETGGLARGWIGDAPVTVVVQARRLEGSFTDFVRKIGERWLEQNVRRVRVPGASDALRLDGIVDFDGLGAPDDRERCVAVCARRARVAVVLTVRSRPQDELDREIESIVASFELRATS